LVVGEKNYFGRNNDLKIEKKTIKFGGFFKFDG